jgi:hypothetical protein
MTDFTETNVFFPESPKETLYGTCCTRVLEQVRVTTCAYPLLDCCDRKVASSFAIKTQFSFLTVMFCTLVCCKTASYCNKRLQLGTDAMQDEVQHLLMQCMATGCCNVTRLHNRLMHWDGVCIRMLQQALLRTWLVYYAFLFVYCHSEVIQSLRVITSATKQHTVCMYVCIHISMHVSTIYTQIYE